MTAAAFVGQSTPSSNRYRAGWLDWRTERERALIEPHGWLSIVGFEWLTSTPKHIGGLSGLFVLDSSGAAEVRDPAPGTLVDGTSGQPVGDLAVADVTEDGSVRWLRQGDLLVELIRRTGRLAVRLRDPAAPTRAGFTGVPTFDVDDRWVIPARFTRYRNPPRITVGAAMVGLSHRHTVIGTVDFSLGGDDQQLLAFGRPDGGAQLLFHDSTNGFQTAGWRTLSFAPPIDDGPVLLDFNRALNLPFSFSDFGTCPRPPLENVISQPVTAGEKRPVPATAAS